MYSANLLAWLIFSNQLKIVCLGTTRVFVVCFLSFLELELSKKYKIIKDIVIMAIEKIKGCIGCGECVQSCPTDVLRLNDRNGKASIQYPEDCQLCGLCSMYCPVDAITITPDKTIPVIISWG